MYSLLGGFQRVSLFAPSLLRCQTREGDSAAGLPTNYLLWEPAAGARGRRRRRGVWLEGRDRAALLLAEQGFEVVGVGADDSFQDSAVEVPSPGRADGVTPPPASSGVAG